jgi:hypothetical protein
MFGLRGNLGNKVFWKEKSVLEITSGDFNGDFATLKD